MTTTTLLFAMPGTQELILIIAVVILMFGGKKIPELMKGLGKGINEFRKGKEGIENEISRADNKL